MPRVSRGGLDAAAVEIRRAATSRWRRLMAARRTEERQIGGVRVLLVRAGRLPEEREPVVAVAAPEATVYRTVLHNVRRIQEIRIYSSMCTFESIISSSFSLRKSLLR
jgi:hypothetical protein